MVTTSDGFFTVSNPLLTFTISSPAKSLELGLIKLLIADACLASTETIVPANNKYSGLVSNLPAPLYAATPVSSNALAVARTCVLSFKI